MTHQVIRIDDPTGNVFPGVRNQFGDRTVSTLSPIFRNVQEQHDRQRCANQRANTAVTNLGRQELSFKRRPDGPGAEWPAPGSTAAGLY